MIFSMFYSPVERVFDVVIRIIQRKHEFQVMSHAAEWLTIQADRFATNLGRGRDLKDALVKLHVKNLGDVDPDPLYSMVTYTHPPLVERLRAISQEEAVQNKRRM